MFEICLIIVSCLLELAKMRLFMLHFADVNDSITARWPKECTHFPRGFD